MRELRGDLANGRIPPDFAAKLGRLSAGSLTERFIEQNCRTMTALLLADLNGSYHEASAMERERLLEVLAYVRKEEDAIPDYLPTGFRDDQQEVRAALAELGPLLQRFKTWRLRYQVPAMWSGDLWS